MRVGAEIMLASMRGKQALRVSRSDPSGTARRQAEGGEVRRNPGEWLSAKLADRVVAVGLLAMLGARGLAEGAGGGPPAHRNRLTY